MHGARKPPGLKTLLYWLWTFLDVFRFLDLELFSSVTTCWTDPLPFPSTINTSDWTEGGKLKVEEAMSVGETSSGGRSGEGVCVEFRRSRAPPAGWLVGNNCWKEGAGEFWLWSNGWNWKERGVSGTRERRPLLLYAGPVNLGICGDWLLVRGWSISWLLLGWVGVRVGLQLDPGRVGEIWLLLDRGESMKVCEGVWDWPNLARPFQGQLVGSNSSMPRSSTSSPSTAEKVSWFMSGWIIVIHLFH